MTDLKRMIDCLFSASATRNKIRSGWIVLKTDISSTEEAKKSKMMSLCADFIFSHFNSSPNVSSTNMTVCLFSPDFHFVLLIILFNIKNPSKQLLTCGINQLISWSLWTQFGDGIGIVFLLFLVACLVVYFWKIEDWDEKRQRVVWLNLFCRSFFGCSHFHFLATSIALKVRCCQSRVSHDN